MELKEFISKTLADIVEGVRQAEKDLTDDVALCYHTNKEYNGYPSVSYGTVHEHQAPLTVVDFKVRVQVREEMSADGKVSAGVLTVLGGEASGGVARSNASTQELSFSIPMVWKLKK